MAGRLKLANKQNMHPWNHIMAACFVCEHLATRVTHPHYDAGYILDIGDVDFNGTYSGTGGKDPDGGLSGTNRAERGACTDVPKGREFLLEEHGAIYPGLTTLKCAITILNNHYPELLFKVFFLNSDWLFSTIFKIFSYWVAQRTRDKFTFCDYDGLQEWFNEDDLPPEFGGTGPALDRDDWMQRFSAAHDREAAAGKVIH